MLEFLLQNKPKCLLRLDSATFAVAWLDQRDLWRKIHWENIRFIGHLIIFILLAAHFHIYLHKYFPKIIFSQEILHFSIFFLKKVLFGIIADVKMVVSLAKH